MSKTVLLLDIDGVLLPWSGGAMRAIENETDFEAGGFDDWEPKNERFFSMVSNDQLSLIQSVADAGFFDIRWLTTWMLHTGMLDYFTEITGFGPHPTLTMVDLPPQHSWWKASRVLGALEQGLFDGYDRILWVDDDHSAAFTEDVVNVADELGFDLVRVAPYPIWSRDEIELWAS